MVSSERGEVSERQLDAGRIDSLLALSTAAGWNQNAADWRLMLELGTGWGLVRPDGALVASTLVLPYGGRFAWVSMVLVRPDERRKGHASRLLRSALAELEARKLTPVLDATPAGREVYAREGFRDTWGFGRLALRAPGRGSPFPPPGVRPIIEADWPAILALDAQAFGASRARLLGALALRLPEAALAAERGGRLVGFLLGRDGREARQLGPLVALDPEAGPALLDAALARVAPPLYMDVCDHAPGLRAHAEGAGFDFQRPFTRMVHGAGRVPGDAHRMMAVAGPELG
jgi:GNAT superfamily N-acetyltransferase